MLSDVQELARKCQELWSDRPFDGFSAAIPWHAVGVAIGLAQTGEVGFGDDVGPIRHAVEVECERRGWEPTWTAYLKNGWTCRIAKRTSEFTWKTLAFIDESASALDTALLALKWLLENPVEEEEG